MNKRDKYRFSFTAGGLLLNESICLATLFVELQNWEDVKKKVMEGNLLQRRAVSSGKRIYREVRRRLFCLSEEEIKFFVSASIDEQRALAFMATCRHYRFIYDYVVEVVRYNYLNSKDRLTRSDYERFVAHVELYHPEYEKLRDSTRDKIRQILHSILREVGLLSSSDGEEIRSLFLSPSIERIIAERDPSMFKVFLLSDEKIAKVLRSYGR